MKRIKQIAMLAILAIGMLASNSVEAKERKPPRGNNYIENGHIFVWDGNQYWDMGPYNPCHGC